MVLLLLLSTLGIYIYIALTASQRKSLIKCVAFAMAQFILSYEVVSVILLWQNTFSFEKTLACMLAIGIVVSVYLYRTSYGNLKVDLTVPWVPIIVIAIALPCMITKHAELFGMGQDEGVYQTEAIVVASGANNVEHKFEEYDLLNTEEEKDTYEKFLRDGNGGFYTNKWSKVFLEKRVNMHADRYFGTTFDSCSGVFHGLHGYALTLALGAYTLGLKYMFVIQMLIYVSVIFIFYYIVERLEKNKFLRLCYTALLALSPLTLWMSKTTYSEIMLLLAVSLYLYGLLNNKSVKRRLFFMNSGVLYFAFSHIIYLIFTPMFYLVNVFLMKKERNKLYGYSGVFAFFILAVTAYIFSELSTAYFFSNLKLLYIGPLINANNILSVLYICCIGISILTYLIWRKQINTDKLDTVFFSATKILAALSLIFAIYYMARVIIGANSVYVLPEHLKALQTYVGHKHGFMHASIMALILSTGIIILPITLYKFLKRDKRNPINKNFATFSIVFVYMACLFPAVLKKEVMYYMYYARYFAYVIPIVLIGYIIYTMDMDGTRKYKLSLLALVFTVVTVLPIVRYKDDTLMQWGALGTIVNKVKGNNAVIFMNSATRVAIHIKNMAGIGAYPLEKNFEKQKERLKTFYDSAYILIQDKGKVKDFLNKHYPNDIQEICDIKNTSSYFRVDFSSFPYAKKIHTGGKDYYLYKINYKE